MVANLEFDPVREAEVPAGPDAMAASIADLLVHRGTLDAAALDRARNVAHESGKRLDAVLVQLGLVKERVLAEAQAELLGVPLITADSFPQKPLFADRLKAKFLRKANAVPLSIEGDRLLVAMADPFDEFTRQAIAAATGRPVAVAVAVPLEVEEALDRLYPELDPAEQEALAQEMGDGDEEDAERLKDLASEAPVIRLVNQIISRAVETQASDIHFEPFADKFRLRYRYDGILHEAESPPKRLTAAIISRIKIMARLDIAERRLPQDGRLQMAVRGQEVDFRVSTIPSLFGEKVVLRVLDRQAVSFDFAKLGLHPAVVRQFSEALELPNGIVLVTGPTGSGKTTTLYTGLLQLNSVVRNVVTVEDPIEYQLTGINQIQVKPQIELTFANLLRSILRQDPDVIMVGEIRDIETAQIAVQAALTGHLVLSTVHTNSAAATITRLRDMGLEDYLVTAVLRGVLAQRLVRRLCRHCRQSSPAPAEIVERFGLERLAPTHPVGEPLQLWHSVGCPHCRGTGYRGRLAIAEFLTPNDETAHLIFSRADHIQIERAAIEAGMVPLFDQGLMAAMAGDTTIEEVVRSIRAEG
jgi:general secretion pathway protein E